MDDAEKSFGLIPDVDRAVLTFVNPMKQGFKPRRKRSNSSLGKTTPTSKGNALPQISPQNKRVASLRKGKTFKGSPARRPIFTNNQEVYMREFEAFPKYLKKYV